MVDAMERLAARKGEVIFALATGTGRAAIAIMRASGAGAQEVLASLCGGRLPKPRHASLRALHHEGDHLDDAMVLWLPGPRSYTGEDGFELHLHAGPAVIDRVAMALTTLGARPAEPGEFTRRAVQAGRLDLLQAEAIADLVEAESQSQRQQALAQADGALSRLYEGWSERLKTLLAHQEALIDFPDEDLPEAVELALSRTLNDLRSALKAHLSDKRGEIVRRGLTVVIAGAPNVGKSSLLNHLAGYDAAIVTHRAGTTRDVIAIDWLFQGVRLRLVDTAGLRETKDEIEAEGIRRAMFHVEHADLVLHVVAGMAEMPLRPDAMMVSNKVDLYPALDNTLGLSVQTGEGMEGFEQALGARIKALTAGVGAPLTRARHRAGIEEALLYLDQAHEALWPEVRGEALRLAMRALGRLTGQVDVDSLLDVIFGQFCIGK
ncbi:MULTISPECIES: tRNA uridine-5-carboxymethylaminomethyl(34) synthesis GTPase MnmE [Asaia]|uniref:tRNA modification GTPase MnmE n=1 Tax=Asaia bogorensis TaxID=91915 RepID=A0A060QLI4_9PROT|nr:MULTISPECIES: tRNA uridine-5-carboxymethylaminomethyl(34) synthesis GTPase MnmE [Asaia]CDG40776.1 GTPase and tRNA-U34 5-formylation enzyme TrmE [Asaia bogorensis]